MKFTTKKAVQLAFKNAKLSKEALDIIVEWYKYDGSIDDFDSIEEFADFIKDDIYDMLDCSDEQERKIVEQFIK